MDFIDKIGVLSKIVNKFLLLLLCNQSKVLPLYQVLRVWSYDEFFCVIYLSWLINIVIFLCKT